MDLNKYMKNENNGKNVFLTWKQIEDRIELESYNLAAAY